MWLVILIVVVLLLRAIATSKTAANIPMATKTVCSSPTAGDSFTQGNTIAAGVPEPPAIYCQHILAGGGIHVYCGLPVHVVYPIAPPPIKITNPTPITSYPKPAPMPVSPIARPIATCLHRYPVVNRPLMSVCSCGFGVCGGGYGGSSSGASCRVSGGGLCRGCDIIASY